MNCNFNHTLFVLWLGCWCRIEDWF